jgi:hypothetical protein
VLGPVIFAKYNLKDEVREDEMVAGSIADEVTGFFN